MSSGSLNSGTNANDYIDTQVESSSRHSCVKLSQVLQQSSLFIEFESLCQQCDKPLREEEILSGFSKNLSAYVIRCPLCKENYVPKFIIYSEYKTDYLKGRDGMSI